MLVCVHGKDGEGLYGEPSHGAAGSGAATDVAAGAVGVAVSGAAAAGAVGVAAGGAVGVAAHGAAGGGAGGANGAVASDHTVPVASVELDASDCDELTSANRCCSIQINITQLPVSYDSPTSSTTVENMPKSSEFVQRMNFDQAHLLIPGLYISPSP